MKTIISNENEGKNSVKIFIKNFPEKKILRELKCSANNDFGRMLFVNLRLIFECVCLK